MLPSLLDWRSRGWEHITLCKNDVFYMDPSLRDWRSWGWKLIIVCKHLVFTCFPVSCIDVPLAENIPCYHVKFLFFTWFPVSWIDAPEAETIQFLIKKRVFHMVPSLLDWCSQGWKRIILSKNRVVLHASQSLGLTLPRLKTYSFTIQALCFLQCHGSQSLQFKLE